MEDGKSVEHNGKVEQLNGNCFHNTQPHHKQASDALLANGNDIRRPTVASLPPNRLRLPPDGGWGWIVCIASFYCNGIVFGIHNSFGVIFVPLKKTFEDTHDNVSTLTALVGSIAIGMTFLMSPVASILTEKLGIRQTVFLGGIISTAGMLLSSFINVLEALYVTYGVILGFGTSLIYTPSLVILGHYFDKRMGLVNGIVATGSSVFTVILTKLLKFSINSIGLPHTMRILAGLLSLTMICALVFKPLMWHVPNDSHKETENNKVNNDEKFSMMRIIKRVFHVKIWKNRPYLIWVVATPSALFGYFVPIVHLVEYMKNILPDHDSVIAVTCMGAASGVGRLVFGMLADFPCVNRIHLQQLSFIMIGICTMLLVSYKSLALLVPLSLIIGLFDGCFISLLGPIAFDIVGTKYASQALGFLLGLCSIPLSVGPPIAGLIYDKMGNYTLAFILAGIPPFFGAIMLCWIHRVRANFPAMSMENIVEDAFKIDAVRKLDNNYTNGNTVHVQESMNEDKTFANIDLSKLQYADEEEGGGDPSRASLVNSPSLISGT